MAFSSKERHCLRVKDLKMIFQVSENKKEAHVALLIYSKIEFKPKLIKGDGKNTSYSPKEISDKVTL